MTIAITRVHPVHLTNTDSRLSARWLPALRPSWPTWSVSPPINGCYCPHPPSPFVIITQPESWHSFYHPTEVEGWVNLGTAGRVYNPCPRLYIVVLLRYPKPTPKPRFFAKTVCRQNLGFSTIIDGFCMLKSFRRIWWISPSKCFHQH